jgi:hypothetical protein
MEKVRRVLTAHSRIMEKVGGGGDEEPHTGKRKSPKRSQESTHSLNNFKNLTTAPTTYTVYQENAQRRSLKKGWKKRPANSSNGL